MTNADFIRSMTDEELALFLAGERYRLMKPLFEHMGFGITQGAVIAKILLWLKEEITERE